MRQAASWSGAEHSGAAPKQRQRDGIEETAQGIREGLAWHETARTYRKVEALCQMLPSPRVQKEVV